ncbi:MAG: TonB-dependent receptor [Candidatus Omnitrophica bacterium]|nr:TonB-dependent receptor [Candidatus Omnitrophota bacterium]
MLYARQDKDAWFFQDEDNDGLYSPFFFEKVNYLGVKLSTEYTWSKTFSHFFSLNIRKIRSKDANYEFVPYEPKQKISLGLAYKITDNCKLDVTGDYSGRRFYERNSKDSSTGYFLLGSKITYEAKDYLTFFVLIDNVLNDHYEIVKKYPNQSRSTLGGVLIKF